MTVPAFADGAAVKDKESLASEGIPFAAPTASLYVISALIEAHAGICRRLPFEAPCSRIAKIISAEDIRREQKKIPVTPAVAVGDRRDPSVRPVDMHPELTRFLHLSRKTVRKPDPKTAAIDKHSEKRPQNDQVIVR